MTEARLRAQTEHEQWQRQEYVRRQAEERDQKAKDEQRRADEKEKADLRWALGAITGAGREDQDDARVSSRKHIDLVEEAPTAEPLEDHLATGRWPKEIESDQVEADEAEATLDDPGEFRDFYERRRKTAAIAAARGTLTAPTKRWPEGRPRAAWPNFKSQLNEAIGPDTTEAIEIREFGAKTRIEDGNRQAMIDALKDREGKNSPLVKLLRSSGRLVEGGVWVTDME